MRSPRGKRSLRLPSAWLLVAVAVVGVAYVGDRWGQPGGWIAGGLLAAVLVGVAYGAWIASALEEDPLGLVDPEPEPLSEANRALNPPSRLASEDGEGEDSDGVQPTHTRLTRAILRGADLSGAKMTDADLTEVDLRGANLSGADLTGAVMRRARLGSYEGPPVTQARPEPTPWE